RDQRPDIRQRAALVLGKLGKDAVPATPALVAALKDGDKSVRAQAVHALAAVAGSTDEVIAALAGRGQDDAAGVRNAGVAEACPNGAGRQGGDPGVDGGHAGRSRGHPRSGYRRSQKGPDNAEPVIHITDRGEFFSRPVKKTFDKVVSPPYLFSNATHYSFGSD